MSGMADKSYIKGLCFTLSVEYMSFVRIWIGGSLVLICVTVYQTQTYRPTMELQELVWPKENLKSRFMGYFKICCAWKTRFRVVVAFGVEDIEHDNPDMIILV